MARAKFDIELDKSRKIARKLSRASGQAWVILKQDDLFHVMSEEQYEKMVNKDEFKFIEFVSRVCRNVGE